MKLRTLDLFSGIGGFSYGLERTGGFETVAFCDIEEYARQVIAKHWPGVPIYEDVREIVADTERNSIGAGLRENEQTQQRRGRFGDSNSTGFVTDGTTRVGPIDVITAGFPCQDISVAGKGAGIEGERSGLWSEVARLTGELRPRYVILENVSALLSRGLGVVLGDLAEIGYDAEWHCIPASSIGAPHRRDRWWCVAYPGSKPGIETAGRKTKGRNPVTGRNGKDREVAYPDEQGSQGRFSEVLCERTREWTAGEGGYQGHDFWLTEPDVGRVAHGVSKRVDRLKGLGNAVVPQIPELIGRAILEAHNDRGR